MKQAETPSLPEVGAGLAQDVVKETRGLTAIREPQPDFKHKTQYFLRGWGAHAWGTVPLYVLPDTLWALGLQRPMSFIQQGQKIDKDEIKYHDIFSMFLVKQKITQARFYCQNVNLCTALGKADSGTHRRSGSMLLLAVPSFLLEIITELLPNQRGIFTIGKMWVKGWSFYKGGKRGQFKSLGGRQAGWALFTPKWALPLPMRDFFCNSLTGGVWVGLIMMQWHSSPLFCDHEIWSGRVYPLQIQKAELINKTLILNQSSDKTS